jgi:hypothetical protein
MACIAIRCFLSEMTFMGCPAEQSNVTRQGHRVGSCCQTERGKKRRETIDRSVGARDGVREAYPFLGSRWPSGDRSRPRIGRTAAARSTHRTLKNQRWTSRFQSCSMRVQSCPALQGCMQVQARAFVHEAYFG